MNDMEIWIFYLVLNLDKYDISNFCAMSDEDIERDGKYAKGIYAFTNKKDLARKFKETRDMRLFKVAHFKDPSVVRSIWTELMESKRDFELEYYEFNTLSIDKRGRTIPKLVQVCCTDREYESVECESEVIITDAVSRIVDLIKRDKVIDTDGLYNWLRDFKNIFKDDIKEALDTLEFTDIIMSYTGMTDSDFRVYEEDTLEIFCSMFYNTFKIKNSLMR
jgi:hypothetical protein